MKISEVCTVDEAILYLGSLTKRPWTTAEFTCEVIRFHLPIYAAAPLGTSIVARRHVNGRQEVTTQPTMSAHYVTLVQDEIEELARSRGPRIITDRPAWLWGDAPYQSWERIAAFRAANHRVLDHFEVEQGEWMGQSDEYFFSAPLQITSDSTLVVPRHTIAELVRTFNGARHSSGGTGMSANTAAIASGSPAIANDLLTHAEHEGRHQILTEPEVTQKKRNNWDQHSLRRLLEESRMPDNTQAVLGMKYDVSRQVIAKQLTKAKLLFERQKSSPFDALNSRGRKK